MKIKPSFFCALLGALSFVSSSCSVEDGRPAKPNVVLILVDDLGWQDVGCYDIDEPTPYETPRLDALAKTGVMFWQGYSPAPTCAPSRAAILSGDHPARAQKTHVVGGAPPVPYHKTGARVISPWYSGRMPADELTIARVLQQNGYTTGHAGKWHIAISHNAYPQPEDLGFDWTRSDRGARSGMKDRLKDFASDREGDPYRLDENGYPFHQNNEDALTFLREHKADPFFLYYATWLVHAPIHTRSKELLDKYAAKMGVDPSVTPTREQEGQINPFYAAMVAELDYYLGTVFDYLDQTEDPRWPGHKLSENTYLIFTSDNGGMEGGPKERYTDNYPLDRGKISAMEGGVRVPLIVRGPGIPEGVQTDVMANGLDFYPTILAMTGVEKPVGKSLDGCDILPLLTEDPQDARLVREADGSVRDTMMWHFPHGGGAMEAAIRVGDYKLVRNFDHVANPGTEELELYRLYRTDGGTANRADIEEARNLAALMPERAQRMDAKLSEMLTEMKASLPYFNPAYRGELPGKEAICEVVGHEMKGRKVEVSFAERGAKVVRADLIYTLNGLERYEEWFRTPAKVHAGGKVSATLPQGTTHFYLNLIDENNFLVSYPDAEQKAVKGGKQKTYTYTALAAE
ncbi:sulfatase [Pelagicoccus sp. SDUM812005]|uniref:sulfatase n=1 Tax=Pelagicoccus sp. SDUM812005 TaxID=3041257 RepID=UPI00280D7AA4|nr:sulfatase [Pelagicoccus sp. SDUM812005]MDQ8183312.1 sulfatase [Pelagicoccus sp. SDUM812005]